MKISLLSYLIPLLSKLKPKQVKANVITLFQRVIREKSIQLWRLAETKNEYNNFQNLVNGQLKNTVDVEKLNQRLLVHQVAKQAGKPSLSLIYDGSDLRKSESEKLENLGWVKSLSGRWIRGYSSFNSIVLDRKSGVIGLLSSIPYSNRDPQFLSEKERQLVEKNKIEDKERHEAIEKYLETEDSYNQKTIYFSSIRSNHEPFKAQNPLVELTHILDRGHDDAALFELIDLELHDKFVIRMKGSRNSTVQAFHETKQKDMFVKMGVVSFAHRAEKTYEKVCFKKKVYVKPHALFEWDTISINARTYNIVRVRFFDCKGVPIFKEPMLIITNHVVTDVITAQWVYQLYLQRSKIEGVFKFLKNVLGWETFRVHDFESIKNLIALCFFIGLPFTRFKMNWSKTPIFNGFVNWQVPKEK